ncbi:MAG: glycosyltransferase [Chlorogloeopsis fritschii C42_A2020_084]|uniref:CgeB family protein n=1 Tax=Chlorogloeopsis fritschii TaxID=1124 RepID=UPI0019FC354B|nr:glycosyltransferase [Chlorogloeopsis fritschii]MBF2004228.1 glycosyltransferase [Chlorogloeopsis fritschii C42_A2020_084]
MYLLLVGGSGGTNIGDALFKAAEECNIETSFINFQIAYEAPKLVKRVNWYFRGKRPAKILEFSKNIIQICSERQPNFLLTTGIAPIHSGALQEIGKRGIQRLNFLTDDPWSRFHYAPWFLKALPDYDVVFSPRRANIPDLLKAGCTKVEYLPFGFNPELFFPESEITQEEKQRFSCDILFVGGADRDRIPYIYSLIQAGLKIHLYGAYWERYRETKAHIQGYADPRTLRLATGNCKIALCLVRRSNRDGHVMRSFEIPAIGACMLTEDTQEHREIFGEEGKAVVYFKTIPEMVEKANWLLKHDSERLRLAQSAHLLITKNKHTYKDRLAKILNV